MELAKWVYWYQNWYPARYSNLGPALGVATTVSPAIWSILTCENECFSLVGRFSVLNKSGYSSGDQVVKYFYFESDIKPGELDTLNREIVLPSVSEYMKNYVKGNQLPRGRKFVKYSMD